MSDKPTVFISYRRADHPDFVERMRDWFMNNGYDDARVFMDLSNMPYFTDFAEFIREKVLASNVVLVVIGPQWLDILHERATGDEIDYVRLEIAIALEAGKVVAPLCIKGAKMPSRDDLQDFPDLKGITRYHAPELDSGRVFLKNIADIIGGLESEVVRRVAKDSKPRIELANEATASYRPLSPTETVELPNIEWVEIPAGEFIFGCDEIEVLKAYNPLPQQQLYLETFYIARYPVTWAQYQTFVEAVDGYANPEWWQYSEAASLWRGQNLTSRAACWPIETHPRENVTWYEAVAFCRWLSAGLGREISLPTESEWEKAARGTDGRIYPWGNEYISGYANLNETYEHRDRAIQKVGPHYLEKTTPVESYPQGASPYGVLDMSGNVLEWCLNEFDNPANIALDRDVRRVVRGGSWFVNLNFARTTSRYWFFPGRWDDSYGFRVVWRDVS